MYTFTYDSQGSHSYLVYRLTDTDRIDTLSLGMITHNQIEGLLPAIYQQKDENQYLKYNISSRISLRQFYAETVNRRQLLGVVSGITNALLRAEEYMIDPDTLLLEMDYIFVDVSSCRAYMVCLPVIDTAAESGAGGKPADINEKVSLFLKDIIFRTQFDQSENLGYVAQIISFMNRPQAFSLPDFRDFLRHLAGDPIGQGSAAAPYPSAGAPLTGGPYAGAPPAGAAPVGDPHFGAPPAESRPVDASQTSIPPYGPRPPAPSAGAPAPSYAVSPSSPPGQRMQPSPQGAAGAPSIPPVAPAPESPPRRKKEKSPQMKPVQPMPPAGGTGSAAPASGEKKMSFMYLMMHYSKENKAIYDAQKKQQAAPPGIAGFQQGAAPAPAAQRGGFPGKPEPPAAPGTPPVPFSIPGVKEEIPGSRQQYPTAPPVTKQPLQPPVPVSAPAQKPAPSPVPPPFPAQRPAYPPMPAPAPSAAGPVSFGETTSLTGSSQKDTTVLGAAVKQEPRESFPYLIRQSNQERIPLSKPLFRIGKEKSFVDYFIGDNTAISRSHAHIITRDGRFFVVDTNSTNHTYHNGQMIPANQETELKHGDSIRLANESFEFRMS